VAVGAGGTIVTSRDEVNWLPRNSGTTQTLRGITYGKGQFVAAGGNTILTSPDGRQWTQTTTTLNAPLHGITFGAGLFVAVGGDEIGAGPGLVMTSLDGFAWTPFTVGDGPFYGIAFGGGKFVAVGGSWVLTSADGIHWVQQSLQLLASYNVLRDIAYGNGCFVAIADNAIVTSTNGVDWAAQPEFFLAGVAFGDGLFVAVGPLGCARFGCFYGKVLTSSDGRNWTQHVVAEAPLLGITHANGTFVTFGGKGEIFTSQDAIRWEQRSPESVAPGFIHRITYGDGKFVAVGWTTLGGSTIVTSRDGAIWKSARTVVNDPPYDVTYGGGQFVAVGGASIHTSTNGSDWALCYSGTTAILIGVAHGNGRFVAIGANYNGDFPQGRVLTSTDATTWSHLSLGTNQPADVSFGNGLFVAVCGKGTIFISPDGMNWTQHQIHLDSESEAYLHHVSYLNGRFFALGSEGESFGRPYGNAYLFTSMDGMTWVMATLPWQLVSLTYHSGVFVGVGYGGMIVTSTDAVDWSVRNPAAFTGWFNAGRELSDITFGNGTFVAVGADVVLQSDPLADTPPILAQAPLGQTVAIGTAASFKVTALGSSPLSYQW
jgi:hypothetical protein